MRRTLMLVAALWLPVYMVFFFAIILEATIRNGGDPDNDLLIPFGLLMGLHIATMLIVIVATVAYVVHAWRNPRIEKDRTLWILVLLLGAPIAMPIYWWLQVRTGTPRTRGHGTSALGAS